MEFVSVCLFVVGERLKGGDKRMDMRNLGFESLVG